MTSDVLDKKEYVTSSRQDVEDTPTFLNSGIRRVTYQSKDSKRSIIRNQWKYIKANYDNNPTPRNILQRGDWYEVQDNYKRAIDFYLEALALEPDSIPIYKKIIDTYVKHKVFDKAEEYFKTLLSITDRYEIFKDYIIFKVSSRNEFSNIDSILELIDSALEKKAEDVDLINLKGFLVMNLKVDISSAKKIFESVLKINKDYIHSVNNLGVCYLREKSYEKAIKYLENALEIDPYNYPFSYQNLTNAYLGENKIKEALNVLDRAVSKNVSIDNNYLHLFAWLLLENLELPKARNLYEKLIRNEPENNLLYNNMGVCYLREGNVDMADDYFKKAVSMFRDQIKKGVLKDTRSLNAFYNIGRIAVSKHDLPTILNISKDILHMTPENPYGFYFAGNYWLQNEDYNGAIENYNKALILSKEIPEVYPDYSFILTSIKRDQKKAIEILNDALKLGYKSNFIVNNLAVAYIKSGDLKKGAEVLKDHNNSEFISFSATRGLLEMRKGNVEKGTALYEEAIGLFKGINKRIASQILAYELALYWFNKKDKEKSLEYLNQAKKYEKSYVTDDIKELEEKLSA